MGSLLATLAGSRSGYLFVMPAPATRFVPVPGPSSFHHHDWLPTLCHSPLRLRWAGTRPLYEVPHRVAPTATSHHHKSQFFLWPLFPPPPGLPSTRTRERSAPETSSRRLCPPRGYRLVLAGPCCWILSCRWQLWFTTPRQSLRRAFPLWLVFSRPQGLQLEHSNVYLAERRARRSFAVMSGALACL